MNNETGELQLERESYHKEDLKSELVVQGIRLLAEEGFEAFSLRKVAKACNVSHAAPYRHFAGKDELIAEIARSINQDFQNALQTAVDRYPDEPEKQLREMGCAYVDFFLDNPRYLQLLFLSDAGHRTMEMRACFADLSAMRANSEEAHKMIQQSPFRVLYESVLRYRAAGDTPLAKMDTNAVLLFCWGLVHGIAVLAVRGEFPLAADIRALTRQIFWSDMIQF